MEAVIAISNGIGPSLGGVISEKSSWRYDEVDSAAALTSQGSSSGSISPSRCARSR